jgi:hypothetical protein
MNLFYCPEGEFDVSYAHLAARFYQNRDCARFLSNCAGQKSPQAAHCDIKIISCDLSGDILPSVGGKSFSCPQTVPGDRAALQEARPQNKSPARGKARVD